MNEYIERKAVFDKLAVIFDLARTNQRAVITDALREVSHIPAADVQPVVRCKDCKYRKERHYEESGEKPYIKYECKFTKYSMSDDGFCSFGARMDGEQND